MQTKAGYAFVGAVIGGVGGIAGNLVASAVEREWFANGIPRGAVIATAAAIVVCAAVGAWLGTPVQAVVENPRTGDRSTVTITRLKAIFSSIQIMGKGSHLDDVKSLGSKISIDTREKK